MQPPPNALTIWFDGLSINVLLSGPSGQTYIVQYKPTYTGIQTLLGLAKSNIAPGANASGELLLNESATAKRTAARKLLESVGITL